MRKIVCEGAFGKLPCFEMEVKYDGSKKEQFVFETRRYWRSNSKTSKNQLGYLQHPAVARDGINDVMLLLTLTLLPHQVPFLRRGVQQGL